MERLLSDLAKAEEHLTAFLRICLISCEEYEDPKKTIAAYRQRIGRWRGPARLSGF